MLDGPLLDDELLDRLGALNEIDEVKFSPECRTQGKEAVLVLSPAEDVSEERLEEIGAKAREVLREVVDGRSTDVRASLEHPIRSVTDEYGNVVDMVDIEDEWVVKLRYRQHTIGGLSGTRLNGREIREGLPE